MEASRNKRAPNARKGASILSIITFGYTFPTFIKGYKRDLKDEDLTEVLEQHRSSILGDKLERSWLKENSEYSQPSLMRAILRVFVMELVASGIGLFISEVILKILQPVALSFLIRHYTRTHKERNVESNSDSNAYVSAGLLVLVSFLNVGIAHYNMQSVQFTGMKIRISCCSLVYRKSLKLSHTALAGTAVGQLTNLLSNDVSRFDSGLLLVNALWLCPTQLIVTACVLYLLLGLTSTIGILFLALCSPFQVFLARKSSQFRLKTAQQTDQRIRLMKEIISGIQIIKMYTWEKPFANLIAAARRLEVGHIRSTSVIKGILYTSNYTTKIAIFCAILVYILTGNVANAEYVFVLTSFYNSLKQTVNALFPKAILEFAEIRVSINRLQSYLLMNEITTKSNKLNPGQLICEKAVTKEAYRVVLEQASASWCESSADGTLQDINLKVDNGQLIAIIGPVGCGKSSIIQVILEELPLCGGALKINGKLSYASQEPWLFGGTIQQNILFGKEMNAQRYAEVIKVCALDHDLAFLPFGDHSLVGERGVILSGGQKARISLARAVYEEADIYLFDDPLSAVDPHVGRQLFDNCITDFLSDKCRILVTHQVQFLHRCDTILLVKDGKIVVSGNYTDIQKSAIDFAKYLKCSENGIRNQATVKPVKREDKIGDAPTQVAEKQYSGSVSVDVYRGYIRAAGSKIKALVILLLFVFAALASASADYFLTYWVNQEQSKEEEHNNNELQHPSTVSSIIIYAGVLFFLMVFGCAGILAFYRYCLHASIHLHNDMFANIVYAPMRLFNITPSGQLLNRFLKDIGAIDEILPTIALDCIHIGLTVAVVVILVGVANHWLLVPTGIIFALFYFIQNVYVSTSRSLKRLDGITRSPVFTHINTSLQGLTTIRAFHVQNLLKEEFDRHQDLHTSAWHLFITCSRTFAFYLDVLSVLYIAVTTFSFSIGETIYGGNVGLAITQSLSLTGMLQWGARQWSELQNSMTAVERVIDYTRIEPEDSRYHQVIPSTWPANGKINFVSLSLRYSTSDPYVLKGLNFSISAKEKIGVVGRTGAGKSSLIAALFQLANTKGSIIIDDINITQIPLHAFRSKISIIPQDPVLFSGTVRKNLDPFDAHTDEELWGALEDVELKSIISETPLGLISLVEESGSNFSAGQRQLLCLARALIRKNKILVLDEATANVDPLTDAIIQETIRKKFLECTVITIAHRLNTVIDSDRILVLDAGLEQEFDHPHILLKNENGMFYSMVQETGVGSAEALFEAAKKSYLRKKPD